MKNIFRHYSTWLLLVGVIVSLFAFLNGADIYQRIKYALAEVNNYTYKNSYTVYLAEIDDMREAINELRNLDGNVVITDNLIYHDATGYYGFVTYVVKQDEDLAYPVKYISNKGNVILGEGLREYCYQNEDSELAIMLDGKEQIVSGFFVNGYSDILDGQIFLELDDDNIDSLLGMLDSVNIEYGSNASDIDTSFNTYYQAAKEKYSIFYDQNSEKHIEVGNDVAGERFYMTIALFAMINCIVISEFWIMRRKEEILIRKLWGFSDQKLFGLMYREMLTVSGIAVAINLLIKVVLFIVNGKGTGEMLLQKVFLALAFMLVSSFIMVAVPVHHASKYRISDGLES